MIIQISRFQLVRNLAIYLTPWALFGWLIGYLVPVMLVALVLPLAWHLWNIYRLNQWLWIKRRMIPPQSHGSWGLIFDGVFRLQQKNRRRRKSLAALLKRFREGSEALPDATIVINDDYRILWCNKLAEHTLGLRWPDDAGNRIDNLIRQPYFSRYLTDKRFDEPLTIPSPVIADVVLEVRVMPYAEDQYLLIVRDVTRLVQLEDTRKNFVASVSHELRTPLTVIQGYLEMAKDKPLPANMHTKVCNTMIAQTARMESLIQQLLTLSQIEMSAVTKLTDEVDVANLIRRIGADAKALSGERNHKINLHLREEMGLKGNESELYSAFSNLIFNAVRYTPDEGCIDIYWRAKDNGMEFSVVDTGDGIAPQHIAKLTERFYRIDPARSRDTGGSGLGLSIVKHALLHHQSELQIQSTLGKGSVFKCMFKPHLVIELPTKKPSAKA